LIATASAVPPIVLITAVTGIVALVAVCSPSAASRSHSLRVLEVLTEYCRTLRRRQ
jgi:hypothetical protein